MEESNILTLKSEIKPAEMGFNAAEIRTLLDRRLNEYRQLVVTEDTQKGCKNAKSELASFRVKLDKFRKEKKKEAMEPIDSFDKEVNELIEMVQKVEKPLNDALDVYEEKERQKKRAFAEKKISEAAEAHGLRPEYATRMVVKKDFMNLTKTLKSIKEDVEAQAAALEKQQAEHDRNIALVRETVETENARISIKLDAAEFLEDFEKTDDILETIRRIKRRAENIFQQEKRLEEERLERERLEKERLERERQEQERLEREKAERERLEQMNREHEAFAMQNHASTERPAIHDADVFDIPPELYDHEEWDQEKSNKSPDVNMNSCSACNDKIIPSDIETSSDRPALEKRESIFEVSFRVRGNFAILRELNNYLKGNGIEHEVVEQKKIK